MVLLINPETIINQDYQWIAQINIALNIISTALILPGFKTLSLRIQNHINVKRALCRFTIYFACNILRIGYGIMPQEIASLLNRVRQPFNANSLAQVGAGAAIEDKAFLGKTLSLVHEGLDFLYESLDRMNIKYFPTQANFFLIDIGKNADEVFEKMLRQGVIVRSMTSYGYPNFIRINVGLHEENVRFLNALEKII